MVEAADNRMGVTEQAPGRPDAGSPGKQRSLPLFGDGAAGPCAGDARAHPAHEISPHLIAARQLARRMRRLKNHSEEQTRTGQAICHHLKALLTETRSH